MSSAGEQPYSPEPWPPRAPGEYANEYPGYPQGGHDGGATAGYPPAGSLPEQPGYPGQPGYAAQQGYPPQPFGQPGAAYPASNERYVAPPGNAPQRAFGGPPGGPAPSGGYTQQAGPEPRQYGYGPQHGQAAPPASGPYPGAAQPTSGYPQQQTGAYQQRAGGYPQPGGYPGAQRPHAPVPPAGFNPYATRFDNPVAPSGPAARPGPSAQRPGLPSEQRTTDFPGKSPGKNRKALIAGAGAVAAVAIGAVLVVPKLSGGRTDPGCTAYAGTTLTAYNKTIADMNAHASQSSLEADIAAATTGLSSAIGQAQRPAVTSALTGLRTALQTVDVGVRSDKVPASAVNGLNAASAAADGAC